eukprot:TRINITY_DN5274_c0_g1_i3.p1 TRINITY_DN5274_c0_g1~~TRINITY_DN5274_c0_g1_i3.p1  ORF type:complete len:391 (-),score=52.53 TRINITY_DN5274_c0_g1_i3:145-1143(-)
MFKTWWVVHKNSPSHKRSMRIMVQIGTIHACLRGKYYLPDGRSVNLNKKSMLKSANDTVMHASDFKYDIHTTSKEATKIQLIEGDILNATIWAKRYYKCNPVCLNMASSSNPGGGYQRGAGAQEENLHRRTNLFACLEDPYQMVSKREWSYPIPELGGIYTPNATVLRGSEEDGYPFLETPEEISFVGVGAYKNPSIEEGEKGLRMGRKEAENTLKKIKAIFNIALHHGHDAVVLGALGCGAYENPPAHIALIMKEAIGIFKGKIKYVIISVIDDHNSFKAHNPKGNIHEFARVFGPPEKLSELLQEFKETPQPLLEPDNGMIAQSEATIPV